MSWTFVLRHARREARTAVRRIGVYMASIALGVAALVAIHGFRDDVARSIQEEAESLMGANVRLSARRPLPDSVATVVDSLVGAGARRADVTTAVSMVLAPSTGTVRLLQLRAVDGAWPFYGAVRTRPEGAWGRHLEEGAALVDPAVLTQLGVGVGDSLAVGSLRLGIVGTVDDLPTDVGFQTAVGPRVWISGAELSASGLLGFGSLARYETYLTLTERDDREAVRERYREVFRATQVDWDTAEGQARSMSRGVEFLGRYLGLVGLGALLLGGVGVASAVHVFVREKVTVVAVLRCLGARQWTAFLSYLLQAGVMGLAGALVGVAVGVAVQQALPGLLGGVLPVEVDTRIAAVPIVAGLAIGLWVALLFALLPLLAVKDVPPLGALRRDFEAETPRRRGDPWRVAAGCALAASVVGLAVYEAPSVTDGLAFAGALTVTAGVLWATARLLAWATRRLVPRGARYTLRQGIANLHRPRNQTVPVTLALGFGVFVVGTVLQVQASLSAELSFDVEGGRPNLLLFDIQPDQVEPVVALLPEDARARAEVTPIVPSRLAAINGVSPEELRLDTVGSRPERWAVRREYRHTYRARPTDTEVIVRGAWWDGQGGGGDGSEARPARISLEIEIAEDLAVGLGDTLTWDVAGRRVTSVVTSLREVDWNRFETNFFVVFEPGVLEDAPHSSVLLTRLEGQAARDEFLRSLVAAHPNVAALDVTRVQEAVEGILGKVDGAVRFLAGFSALAGVLVLAAALATSRYQRMREGALLRTLGARRAQVLAILAAEYAALGALAALTGLVLATGAAALVAREMFEIAFVPAPGAIFAVWAGVTALTLATGLLGSRATLARPPLPVLRETVD